MEDSTGWLLNYAGRLAVRRLASKLQPHNITPPQWGVLVRLSEKDGQSLSELGARALFDGPTMTGIVDRLETGGFVERRRDSSDRRVINLYLTQRGRELVQTLPLIGQDTDRDMLAGISSKEQECFVNGLRKVIANLS